MKLKTILSLLFATAITACLFIACEIESSATENKNSENTNTNNPVAWNTTPPESIKVGDTKNISVKASNDNIYWSFNPDSTNNIVFIKDDGTEDKAISKDTTVKIKGKSKSDGKIKIIVSQQGNKETLLSKEIEVIE